MTSISPSAEHYSALPYYLWRKYRPSIGGKFHLMSLPYHITGRNSCVQFWLLQCTSLLFLASDLIGFTGYTHALLNPQFLLFHLSGWTCRFADYSKMFWPWKVMLTFPENFFEMETMVKKSLNSLLLKWSLNPCQNGLEKKLVVHELKGGGLTMLR